MFLKRYLNIALKWVKYSCFWAKIGLFCPYFGLFRDLKKSKWLRKGTIRRAHFRVFSTLFLGLRTVLVTMVVLRDYFVVLRRIVHIPTNRKEYKAYCRNLDWNQRWSTFPGYLTIIPGYVTVSRVVLLDSVMFIRNGVINRSWYVLGTVGSHDPFSSFL